MENCADMDYYQNWAWNDLNCETAQANVTSLAFSLSTTRVQVQWWFPGFCLRGCRRCDESPNDSTTNPTNLGTLSWGGRYMGGLDVWMCGCGGIVEISEQIPIRWSGQMGRLTIPATLSSSLIMRLPGQYDQRSFAIIIMICPAGGQQRRIAPAKVDFWLPFTLRWHFRPKTFPSHSWTQ